jgi:hypothetical protein
MEFTRLEPTGVNTSAEFTFANISAGNVKTDNLRYANGTPYSFSGGGTYANSNVASYLPTYTGDITGNTITLTGNLTSINASLGNLVTANYFTGSGNLLSNIQAANVGGQVSNALVSGTVYTNSQPNITSVGTLTSLSVTNDAVIGGNLTVNGTTTTVNSTTLSINDINIVLANNASTAVLANGAGITINGASANILYNSTSNSFTFSHPLTANGSLLTAINGSNVTSQVGNSLIAGTVYSNAQPNITSLGTLTSLTSGLITATSGGIKVGNIQDPSGTNTISLASGNVTMLANLQVGIGGTGNVTATYFIGNGSQLTGTIANATYALSAGTVTTAAQPNITSLGTLSSLNVTGTSTFASSQEVTVSGTPSGTVNYDLYSGVVFDVTPVANWTANVSNIATTNNRATVVTFIINQGSTPYIPNVFQISGVGQTVKWINSTAPTGTASKIDVIAYSLVRSSAGAWTVLGQSATYG